MTAPVGTDPFTTKESTQSEENHTQWVHDVISELGPDYRVKQSMTIKELIGKEPTYALLKNGKSQEWKADGGFVFYKGKLVGVAENKWQTARENVCERACRYLTFLKGKQLFVSTYGPGFILKYGGGATGSFLDMLMFSGACVTENVYDEQEFKTIFKKWLLSLTEG